MIDECGLEILQGPGLPFETRDTVDASAMTGKILYGCVEDTIVYDYPNQDQVNKWAWVFAPGDTVHSQHFFRTFTVFDGKTVQLIASNDLCSDTASLTVVLDNAINAAFEAPQILCPRDAAVYKNNSTGNLNSWVWDLGDGTTDQSEDPSSHLYAETGIETKYRIRLIVGNYLGCKDTAYQDIDVLRSCYIAVPSAFTPNGDGLNDYLYPLNAYKAINLEFRVYNRYGQLVFVGRDWLSKWDGRINGNPQPPGTYVWMLQYTDGDTKKKIFMKGTSVLIR
jgi:gliding motility-associated-like protein